MGTFLLRGKEGGGSGAVGGKGKDKGTDTDKILEDIHLGRSSRGKH